MADAIWNDRWILSNGAVSANAPLSGDGSNSQPLGLDLKTDNSLSGNGTLTSPLGVVPGYNETVLWSGTGTSANINNITFTENVTAFDRIGFYWEPFRLFGRDTAIDYSYTYTEVQNNPQNLYVLNQLCPQTNNNNKPLQVTLKLKTSGTNLSSYYGYYASNNTWYPQDHVDYTILKVIGINRK